MNRDEAERLAEEHRLELLAQADDDDTGEVEEVAPAVADAVATGAEAGADAVVTGVELGAAVAVAAEEVAPPPPSPEEEAAGMAIVEAARADADQQRIEAETERDLKLIAAQAEAAEKLRDHDDGGDDYEDDHAPSKSDHWFTRPIGRKR